jgi:hypothetical protein
MTVTNAKELLNHLGHPVEVVRYMDGSACIECRHCCEVLVEFAAPNGPDGFYVEDRNQHIWIVTASGYASAESRVARQSRISTVAVWEYDDDWLGYTDQEPSCELCGKSISDHPGRCRQFIGRIT